jgi:MFS family permease
VSDPRGGGSAFAALTSRDFRVFWFGVLVSRIGESMQMFAVGWLVFQLAVRDGGPERAALYAGILGLARLAPALVVGVISGAVVDRVDRRTTLFVEESAALVSTAALGILTIAGAVSFGWVLVYGVVSTVSGTFERLTR